MTSPVRKVRSLPRIVATGLLALTLLGLPGAPAAHAETVLYEAGGAAGWAGWIEGDGWSMLGGDLVFGLPGNWGGFSDVRAPYRPPGADYAVEADISTVSSGSTFAIRVRGEEGRHGYLPGAGYAGGMCGPRPSLADLAAGSSFCTQASGGVTPGIRKTYRLEASGNNLALKIDGATVATLTDNKYLQGSLISVISARSTQLVVHGFRVLALSESPGRSDGEQATQQPYPPESEGIMIRCGEGAWLLEGGRRRAVPDAETFNSIYASNGGRWQQWSEEACNRIPRGPDVPSQAQQPYPPQSEGIVIPADQGPPGVDTGIDVRAGQELLISASGRAKYGYQGATCVGDPETDLTASATSGGHRAHRRWTPMRSCQAPRSVPSSGALGMGHGLSLGVAIRALLGRVVGCTYCTTKRTGRMTPEATASPLRSAEKNAEVGSAAAQSLPAFSQPSRARRSVEGQHA